MKRILHHLLVLFILASCQSGTRTRPPELIPPEVTLRQIGGIPDGAARHIEGGMPVHLQAVIISRSSEDLAVDRIEVASRGRGAYFVPPTSIPFGRTIKQDRAEAFDLWVPTTTEDTIVGVSGPVTIQLTVFYESAYGRFREVYSRDINTSQVRERRE